MGRMRGQVEILILVILAAILIPLFLGGKDEDEESGTPGLSAELPKINSECCDLGSGNQCRPVPTKYFKWKGTNESEETYQLLKSDVAFTEGNEHLVSLSSPDDYVNAPDNPDLNGRRIFVNNMDTVAPSRHPECAPGDLVSGCKSITNDLLIYVCKPEKPGDCIGDTGVGRMDTYIRTSLGEEIPEFISNCDRTIPPIRVNPHEGGVVDRLICPTSSPAETDTLQINYCKFVPRTTGGIPWLSPWCKPAIYLYPEVESNISVKVFPKGRLTFTKPHYPVSGWFVTANPAGNIDYQGQKYDYLYYEAEIPDELIRKPADGYSVHYDKLESFFASILPRLGLSKNETSQFSDYWLKALPKSSYYFIGIIPEDNLDEIAPLSINPSSSTIIRVTLFFQATDGPLEVPSPEIKTPERSGFTVVEWGGIVKTDPNHPFSCLM